MLYKFVRKIAWLLAKFFFFLRIEGVENIPKEGGVVICANHRSLWDAVLIAGSIRRPMAYIAKAELFKNKLFGAVLRKLHAYPVKRGGGDLAIAKTALTLLKNGEALMIFPEGERIRKGKKPVLKPGAFRLALMAGVPIVPIGIGGNFRWFRKMHVRAGHAIDVAQYEGNRYTEEEYAAFIGEVMEKVYALAETERANV